ncbi:hypothetical protein FA13DRAFT_1717160 [Coprinellus micaceus]|uniref:Uncharacterized protein n=1 Tax=Coprinellus micaceus TaxID=71717 RepID=A0A4Y7SIZ0_COPMI|nr:hypothetical protein FA13DRAFT_1717160 [Coprinellus micaceus]
MSQICWPGVGRTVSSAEPIQNLVGGQRRCATNACGIELGEFGGQRPGLGLCIKTQSRTRCMLECRGYEVRMGLKPSDGLFYVPSLRPPQNAYTRLNTFGRGLLLTCGLGMMRLRVRAEGLCGLVPNPHRRTSSLSLFKGARRRYVARSYLPTRSPSPTSSSSQDRVCVEEEGG